MSNGNERQILVTNDDGVDAIGLHVLARAMRRFGKVTVVAPDGEYSGSGASIGPIWDDTPDVHTATIEGIDDTWAVSGPPALCVLYARLGTFGFDPDLVVSGINPGANVGRSVYHSGTIGGAISARIGGIPGVAVSQSVSDFGVEGQAWGDVVAQMRFDTAAAIAAEAIDAMLANPSAEPGILNINVPDLPLDEVDGWQWCEVGTEPVRALAQVNLTPKPGHTGSFNVSLDYGEPHQQAVGTDTGAIMENKATLSWLSAITALDQESPEIDRRLKSLLD